MDELPHDIQPVTLPSWPSCKDCLCWSGDRLACAGGEFVHILELKTSVHRVNAAGHPQWHVTTIQTSHFSLDEWPYQSLATLSHFSIGEEQSTSTVAALQWSPPGLGIYRRSVLAVLTTNLLLTLWETDGTPGQWRRTCIINRFLKGGAAFEQTDSARRSRRIRSFTWCEPLHAAKASKWGHQHLALTDDDGDIVTLQLSKRTNVHGKWSVHEVARHKIPHTSKSDMAKNGSLFRRVLMESPPVSKLRHSPWQGQGVFLFGTRNWASTLEIRRNGALHKVKMLVMEEESQNSLHYTIVDENPSTGVSQSSLGSRSRSLEGKDFAHAIQTPGAEYNELHNLGGHYRVKFWGTAKSDAANMIAACITMHPSDVLEYTTASTENCVLVFERRGGNDNNIAESIKNAVASDVHQKLLAFIVEHSQRDSVKSKIDKSILQAASEFVRSTFAGNQVLWKWSQDLPSYKAEEIPAADSMQIDEPDVPASRSSFEIAHSPVVADAAHTLSPALVTNPSEDAPVEKCEACETFLTFISEPLQAKCQNGHQFVRCSLCFVAIQEPGISKYCSQCGKQFLAMTKLETDDGPSLSQALFDEFDVCPYCQGKFRC